MSKIIFCEDPLQPRKPDEVYQAEADAAVVEGLQYAIVNYEVLVNDHDPVRAARRVSQEELPTLGIYRGWMLTPSQYTQLYNALSEKGIELINTPDSYRHCHYLPESYLVIEAHTPKSVWLHTTGDVAIDEIMACLKPFGTRPVILKDFVKSQKHYWQEACFIPSASDREAVERVVKRFLDLQGDSLNEGLVFREYIEFEPLTTHSKSGMPLTKEYRIFVLDGKPLYIVEYWEEGDYQKSLPPIDEFRDVMQNVKSRFFTMDVAKRKDGDWMIVELGDAQVAGLPESVDVHKFYEVLNEKLHS